jgi:hypothetical protein
MPEAENDRDPAQDLTETDREATSALSRAAAQGPLPGIHDEEDSGRKDSGQPSGQADPEEGDAGGDTEPPPVLPSMR